MLNLVVIQKQSDAKTIFDQLLAAVRAYMLV